MRKQASRHLDSIALPSRSFHNVDVVMEMIAFVSRLRWIDEHSQSPSLSYDGTEELHVTLVTKPDHGYLSLLGPRQTCSSDRWE